MNKLQKWAHVAEITGALVVVLSLIYVGYQIRQNTAAQQSETELNLYNLTAVLDSWYQDPAFVSIVAKQLWIPQGFSASHRKRCRHE